MIGLVIVIVLIVVGALFYVKFLMISDENKLDDQLYGNSLRANNMMGAIVNVEFCNYSVGEIFSMIGTTIDVCDGQNSKEVLDAELPGFFAAAEITDYSFWVMEGQNEVYSLGECEYGLESASPPILIGNRYFKTHLRFCTELSTE